MGRIIEKDWQTKAGLRAVCLIVTRDDVKSHRCGYVRIPPEHPLYGVGYSEHTEALGKLADDAKVGKRSPLLVFTASVDAPEGEDYRRSPDVIFNVHGGLTYSEYGTDNYPTNDPKGWWFGFDCLHLGDASMDPSYSTFEDNAVVRSLDYVVEECESLAQQLMSIPQSRN